MRNLNLNVDPFWRMSIGFDRLHELMDESLRSEPEEQYPPYNFVRTGEETYQISLALAGFKPDQITVTPQQGPLLIAGQSDEKQDNGQFLYRGIAGRSFQRRFNLAEYVEVTNASMEDGVLRIELERRVPEPMKPRKIEIGSGNAAPGDKARTIDHSKAA